MKRALLSLVILCMTTIAAWAQGKVITGRVLDKAGEAVIGASVLEVGTTNGSLTDIEGRFKGWTSPSRSAYASSMRHASRMRWSSQPMAVVSCVVR